MCYVYPVFWDLGKDFQEDEDGEDNMDDEDDMDDANDSNGNDYEASLISDREPTAWGKFLHTKDKVNTIIYICTFVQATFYKQHQLLNINKKSSHERPHIKTIFKDFIKWGWDICVELL